MKKAPLSLTEFRAANTVVRERCSLADLAEKLSPKDRETIRQALADPSIQATAITRVLRTKFGWMSNHQVVARHRRRTCICCDNLAKKK